MKLEQTKALASVLRDHQFEGRPRALCSCGWNATSDVHGYHEDHRLHVANQMADLVDQVRNKPEQMATFLREVAEDSELIWNVARRAIEDELVDWRDRGLMQPLRNNGLVIKYKDGTPNDIIRFGPETAVRVALDALAEHFEQVAS